VTDASGCTASENISITEPADVLAGTSTVHQNVSCNGGSDGSASVAATGGTSPYSYLWEDGTSTQDNNALTAGAHTVTIIDAKLCTATVSVVISEPAAALSGTVVSAADAKCFGGVDGEAGIDATGGTSPYTFEWPDGSALTSRNDLSAGTYAVTVRDANLCESAFDVTIGEPSEIVGSATVTPVTCTGYSNGSADLSASGGAGGYTFTWPDASNAVSRNDLSAGTYTVTINDANACFATTDVVVTEPADGISIAVSLVNNVSCNGGSDGAVTVVLSGGTPGYTQVWNDGSTDLNRDDLSATTYSIVVTDASGCTATENISITEPDVLAGTSSVAQNVSCNGGTDGSATVTPTGGTAPYSYAWTDGTSTQDNSALSAGTHTVTITDANACTATVDVVITEPDPIVVSADITDVSCWGQSDGTATINPVGGTSPYLYSWPSGSTNKFEENLAAGTYTITVEDINLCEATYGVVIAEPLEVEATITVENPISCFGKCDGQMRANVSGGTAPYIYEWDDPASQTTEVAVDMCNGYYTVRIIDANGCVYKAPQELLFTPQLVLTPNVRQDVSCNGLSDGDAYVEVIGGTAPYTYAWPDGVSEFENSGLAAGTYTVTVSDAGSCAQTVDITITEPSVLTIASSNVTNVLCKGDATGGADLTITGGTEPYTVLWPDNSNALSRADLLAGTYSVSVTDANNCTAQTTLTITEPSDALTLVVDNTKDVGCNGGSDGAINITVSGGTGAITYAWSDGGTGEDRAGLSAGTYTVTATDENNCEVFETVVISEPAQTIVITLDNKTDVSCFGNASGEINITTTGGSTPYIFNWSDGSTDEDRTGLTAGTYSIVVVDDNACTASETYTISEPAELIASATTVSDVDCKGSANGQVDVSVSDGTAPYTVNWEDGTVAESRNDLIEGTYLIVVRDANNCEVSINATVAEPTEILSATSTITDATCFGSADGSALVVPTGGTAPYTYLWDDNSTADTRSALGAGTYSVTVNDANNCEFVLAVSVAEPAEMTANVSIQKEISCDGQCDGEVAVAVSGGTAPYSFIWNDASSQTADVATALCEGNYEVTVTDANNCESISLPVSLQTEPLAISVSVESEPTCNGDANGVAELTVSGGVAPYIYAWPNGGADARNENLTAGTHTVSVTDDNGCQTTTNITMSEPDAVQIAIVSSKEVSCKGEANGEVTVEVTGGVEPYAFTWTDGETAMSRTALIAGTYDAIVSDANACTATLSVSISEPTEVLSASATVLSNPLCDGKTDGHVQIVPVGGTAPYAYAWTDGSTDAERTDLGTGSYTVTVSDANLCEDIVTFNLVPGAGQFAATTVVDNNVSCKGGNDGQVTISENGGSAPYIYNWNDGGTGQNRTDLSVGSYEITVIDANACISITIADVTEPLETIQLTTAVVAEVTCNGNNNGHATITATGGTAPYTYDWPDGGSGAERTDLAAGIYDITVSDINSCSEQTTITISEPAESLTLSSNVSNVSCNGGADGAAEITATGGTAPYSFAWEDATTDPLHTDLTAGDYTVTVADANGCNETILVQITEPDQLAVSVALTQDLTCFGDCTGEITATTSGGTGAVTYAWNDPSTQTADVATGLCAGSYEVTVTDENACQVVSAIIDISVEELVASATVVQEISCAGQADAIAEVVATGGTPVYSIEWEDGSTDFRHENLAEGTYTYTVTDANLCNTAGSVVISKPVDALTASVNVSDVQCKGGNDGAVQVTATLGTQPYEFNWADGFVGDQRIGLNPGSYEVTVSDANGCFVVETAVISEPADAVWLSYTLDSDVSCKGSNDGSATLAATGGTGAFTYTWPDGVEADQRVDLLAGSYIVSVEDEQGCVDDTTVVVSEPAEALTLNYTIDNQIGCSGAGDGAVTLTSTGGTGLHVYEWPDGSDLISRTDLDAGNYIVTVTDENNCQSTATFDITEPADALVVSTSVVRNLTCKGGNDGEVTVSVANGTPAYTYTWSDGGIEGNRIDLTAGTHTLTVQDQNGCTATASVELSEPADELVVTAIIGNNVSCKGGSDGAILVNATGGVPNYTYDWADGDNSTIRNGLTAGVYDLTVTDANGCDTVLNIEITEPAEDLAINITDLQNATCNGGNNGSATVEAVGGTAPYSYVWFDASVNETYANLPAGSYKVDVLDFNNCQASIEVLISEPVSLEATATVYSGVGCKGESTGRAEVSVTGGTEPYEYLWPDNTNDSRNDNLLAGTHTVTVTDANSCSTTIDVEIVEPELGLVLDYSKNNDVLCWGQSNASVTLQTIGGTAEYSYVWPDGSTDATRDDLAVGDYEVTVTDANGCETTKTIEILEPQELYSSIGAPYPFLISATTEINVCFNATHELVQDIGFYLMAPDGTTVIELMKAPAETPGNNFCNAATDIKDFCFSTSAVDNFNSCPGSTTGDFYVDLEGTWAPENPWSMIYGMNPTDGGWSTQIVDFKNGKDGVLQNMSLTFRDKNAEGEYVTVTYETGDINEPILSPEGDEGRFISFRFPTREFYTSCYGVCDAQAIVSIQGGVEPYTVDWLQDGVEDVTDVELCAGDFDVLVTDANGCTSSANVTVYEPDEILAAHDSSDVVCYGDNTGSAEVTASQGFEPYSYEWADGQTSSLATNLYAGYNNVTITDDNGCERIDSVMVNSPEKLSITASQDSTSCVASADGAVEVAPSGGIAPYEIKWFNDATDTKVSSLVAGTYNVTITDANLCVLDTTAEIFAPEQITITLDTIIEPLCYGDSAGVIAVNVSGGTGEYDYAWSDGSTNDSLIDAVAGDYDLTITDANACTNTETFTLTQPDTLLVSIVDVQQATCSGQTNGKASVVPTGGTAPYTYKWSTEATDSVLTDAQAGRYYVTVSDANGCTGIDSVDIDDSYIVTLTMDSTNLACNNDNSGTVSVTVQNGVEPYAFAWNNSSTDESLSSVSAGKYIVTVTDANGCFSVDSVTLTEPEALTASYEIDSVSCAGLSDGKVAVIPAGGVEPYVYAWDTGSTDSVLVDIPAKQYTVTVSDANNCALDSTLDVFEPASITITATETKNPSCYLDANGYVKTLVEGGNEPYTYSWNTGADADSIIDLTEGTYKLTVADAEGCIDSAEFTLIQPDSLVATITDTVHLSKYNANDGKAVVTATGGTADYTYAWTDGQLTDTASNLTSGLHKVTVTDANGCMDYDSVVILQPDSLVVSISLDQAIMCYNDSSAQISAVISGGVEPIAISWSTSDDVATLTDLGIGSYSVTVTDLVGSSDSATIEITQPEEFVLNEINSLPTQCAALVGEASVSYQGGVEPYSVLWSNNETTDTIKNLGVGLYTVQLADANGCIIDTAVTVLDTSDLAVTISADIPSVKCIGGASGQLTATPEGGTEPYGFTWSNGAQLATASDLPADMYYVTVTDANQCTRIDSMAVTTDSVLAVESIVTEMVTCNGLANGSIDVKAKGGTPFYLYTWRHGELASSIADLSAGTYYFTVTDITNCSISDSVVITEPNMLVADTAKISDILCAGTNSGQASITPLADAGTAPYSYAWSNGETDSLAVALEAGWNYVTVSDANGCEYTDSVEILETVPAMAVEYDTTLASCGLPDGGLTAKVTGGVKDYTFNWSNGGTDSINNSIPSGLYYLSVTDANGCILTDSVMLSDTSDIAVAIADVQNVICGDCSGTATALATNGTEPYAYAWSNGDTLTMADSLCIGTHMITVTDADQCSAVGQVDINNDGQLMVELAVVKPVSCQGLSDAEVVARPIGGAGNYDITWSVEGTDTLITALSAGKYFVTISDGSCSVEDSIVVTDPDVLEIDLVSNDVQCAGDTAGSIAVVPVNGIIPDSYLWSDTQTDSVAVNLPIGEYIVTVTYNGSCTVVDTAEVSEPDSIQYVIAEQLPECGVENGELSVSVTGGIAPYSYNWMLAGMIDTVLADNASDTIKNIASDYYAVEITDANGCSVVSQTHKLSSVGEFAVAFDTLSGITCHDRADGYAVVNPGSIHAPFTYEWWSEAEGWLVDTSSSDSTGKAKDLAIGSYKVYITDTTDCRAVASFEISDDKLLQSAVTITASSVCGSSNDAKAEASAINGMPFADGSYEFLWSTGDTTAVADSLAEGTYYVTISDSLSCSVVDSVIITAPAPLVASIEADTLATTCYTSFRDTVFTNVTGGIAPYSYEWSNGDVSAYALGLSLGKHYVTITDSVNCSSIVDSVIVRREGSFSMSFDTTFTSCGDSIGTATATVNGGAAPYIYEWSNGDTLASTDSLWVDFFGVTVTDANGCAITDTIDIADGSDLAFAVQLVEDVRCEGMAVGKAEIVSVEGGTGVYSYLWSNGDNRQLADTLRQGNYVVKVFDEAGCASAQQFEMLKDSVLQNRFKTDDDISCDGNPNGSVTALVSGGVQPYSYNWNSGQDTNLIAGLEKGMYILTVTDAQNCIYVDSVEILENPMTINFAEVQQVKCNGDSTGLITVEAIGGYGNERFYNWSNGDSLATADSLKPGLYYVTVTEEFNPCYVIDSVEITEPADYVRTYEVLQHPTCTGTNGSVVLSISGGSSPFEYEWESGETDSIAKAVSAGYFKVTVTDANGCEKADSVSVIDNNQDYALEEGNGSDVRCYGLKTGRLSVVPSNGTEPYTYNWSHTNELNSPSATGLGAGDYSVTVTDAGGCVRSFEFDKLVEPQPVDVKIKGDSMIVCRGGTATINAEVTGGNGNYSYYWHKSGTQDTLSELVSYTVTSPDTYMLKVYDDKGCTADTAKLDIQEAGPIDARVTIVRSDCYEANGSIKLDSIVGDFPGFTFEWEDESTDSLRTGLADTENGSKKNYTLSITDAAGCETKINYNVLPLKINKITFDPITERPRCNMYSYEGKLSVDTVTGGVAPFTYKWRNHSDDYGSDSDGKEITDLNAGQYVVTVTGANHCFDTARIYLDAHINIYSHASVNPDSTVISDTICMNVETPIYAGNNKRFVDYPEDKTLKGRYKWFESVENIYDGEDSIYKIKINEKSYYNLVYYYDGCISDSSLIKMDVYPELGLDAEIYIEDELEGVNETDVVRGFEVTMKPTSTDPFYMDPWFIYKEDTLDGFVDYKWTTFTDQFTLNGYLRDSVVDEQYYLDNGHYKITTLPEYSTNFVVTATTTHGCIEKDTTHIKVLEDILVPTGITPNGDGENDQWIVPYLRLCPDALVVIYNRWGIKVFERDKDYYNNPFEGLNENGKELLMGTYYYYIEFNDDRGTKARSGPITVVR